MRVAAIDVGTNSIHLLVAEIAADGTMKVVEKDREQVELGSGGLAQKRITDAAWQRGMDAMVGFRAAIDSLGAVDTTAAATSAVREAENGSAFCRAVRERTGIHIRTISGSDEARLIYLGARSSLDFSRGRALIVDVGGGSTEFILCDTEHALFTKSVRIGHIRLAETHGHSDPLSDDDFFAMKADVKTRLKPLRSRIRRDDFHDLVATSGAARTLARIATLERGERPPEHGHGLVLHRHELEALIERFRNTPSARLSDIPGMDPRRRRTLPAAAIIFRRIMKNLRHNTLVTSERGLRDGLIVSWLLEHAPQVQLMRSVPDPRRRSVHWLKERYGADDGHASHVADMATRIFDATAGDLGLRVDDRMLLQFAAQLHDIGHHIDGKGHNKHGAYLIRHTRLYGFRAPELEVLANVVRYHRGSKPKNSHPVYGQLPSEDRKRVKALAGILRVADALDRGHGQNVLRLEVSNTDDALLLRATTRDAPDLEQWASVRRAELLEEVLDRPVRIEVQRDQEAADDDASIAEAEIG